MLNRRSFMAALAGLPVLGRVMQRAPLPSDTPLVTQTHPFLEWEATLPPNTVTAYGNWPSVTVTNARAASMTTTLYRNDGTWVLATDPRWPDAVAYGESTEDADAMLDAIRADLTRTA